MDGGTWLNPPAVWSADAEQLDIVTDASTDFWRETHYGFVRDSGHFYGFRAAGAFTAQVRVRGDYQAQYDQAGFMVRVDAERWVKAGIERSDGQAMLSSVLTAGRSDWAAAPYADDPGDLWLRATAADGVLRLQVSRDGLRWPLMRLAPFPVVPTYLVGPMACTPKRAGLAVRFSDFRLGPPLGRDLHDLG